MILVIDNYDSFTYNLVQIIAGFDEVTILRNDDQQLQDSDLSKYNGIIISPGPGRPENAGLIVSIIRKYYRKLPILGVCLGHQAIAYAFGGKIISAAEIVHGKTDKIFHCSKSIFKDLPLPFTATRYHSLTVVRDSLPDELQVTAETANGQLMGLVHNDYPTYGVQFHPESIASDAGELLIEKFIQLCHRGEKC